MDRIVEQLSKLQELSADELNELEELALAEFETAKGGELSADSVATMNKLADAVEAARIEKARRVTEAQALEDAAAEAAARIAPVEEAAAPAEGDEAEAEAEDPEESPTEAAVEVEVEPVDPEDPEEDEDEVIVASAPVETPAEVTPAAPVEALIEAAVAEPTPAPAPTEAAVAEPVTEPATEAAVETPSEPVAQPTEASAAPAEIETEAPAAQASSTNDQPNIKSQEDPVTADATPQGTGTGELSIEPPADRQPQIKPATTVSITAGADIPGHGAGTPLKDNTEVAQAFVKRLHSLRHVHGGDGEQHIVASYRQEFPAQRQLSANDPLENTDKIHGVTSPQAITAAAGVCLPLETRYELGCDVGVTDRPVRDALARFGSDRGGVRFFKAPALEDSAAATGFWRSEDGSEFHTYGPDRVTPTSPVDQKPCLEVQCAEEDEAFIEAITLCLTFNNLTTRTFPELIKRHNELALVAHARAAENALLAQIEAGSSPVSGRTQIVGATRELLNIISAAVAAYKHKHRVGKTPLRMILPEWVRDFIKADLALQAPGDGMDDTLGLVDAKIDAWFKSRGVNITWHLDGVGPAAIDLDGAGSGLTLGFEFPGVLEFALFAEGTWLFLDGGTLDLGVIRDSSLVATNQYKQFVETFEGVANIGCDSYWVSTELKMTGQAAALVDTLV